MIGYKTLIDGIRNATAVAGMVLSATVLDIIPDSCMNSAAVPYCVIERPPVLVAVAFATGLLVAVLAGVRQKVTA